MGRRKREDVKEEEATNEETNEEINISSVLQEAFLSLDSKNDEHWTPDGLPRIDAIQALSNILSITRQDIEQATQGYRRIDCMNCSKEELSLRMQIKEKENRVAEYLAIFSKTKKQYEDSVKELDVLLESLNKIYSKNKTQFDIQQYFASQSKHAESRKIAIAQINDARSPIDKAMARQTGYGKKRPIFTYSKVG